MHSDFTRQRGLYDIIIIDIAVKKCPKKYEHEK